jgi:hypothetical protein
MVWYRNHSEEPTTKEQVMGRGSGHFRTNGRSVNSGMNAAKVITVSQMNPAETPELHEEIAKRAAEHKPLQRLTDDRAIALSDVMLDLFTNFEQLASSCIRERIGLLFAKALHYLRFDHISEDPIIQDARKKTEEALRQVFEAVSQAA